MATGKNRGISSYIDSVANQDKDLEEKKNSAVNLGTTTERTALATGGPIPSESIGKAADMKATSKNIAAAQAGAKILGIGPDNGDTSVEGGAASGAMSGAAMGAKFGGYGAAIGGVVGGVAGGLGASAAQKDAHRAAKEKAKAKHAENMGRIEEEKDSKIQSALGTMKQAFGRNLNNNKIVKL